MPDRRIHPEILLSAVRNPIYRFLGHGRLALPTLNEIASIFVYLPLCFCHLALIYDVILTELRHTNMTYSLPPSGSLRGLDSTDSLAAWTDESKESR